ncbi:hypothetical protein RND81_02G087000 [Saponaria officinalis]|uniref:Pentatricopeptide repeat-containing protein n=1 Tax=Saponaria officinalis TaxID=3572 RepID=A0AAW1MSF8_SAPOF
MAAKLGAKTLNRFIQTNTTIAENSTFSKAKSVTNTILSLLDDGHLRKAVSLLFSSPFPFEFPLYGRLFHLCATTRAAIEARKVESHLVTYYNPPPTFLMNRAIETYGKCGCLRDARELFDEMRHRDGGSWNALITAYSQGGDCGAALLMFSEMFKSGVSPSEVTFASVLGSCGVLLEFDFARMVHGVILKTGFDGNVILGSALVDVYGKCGVMVDAKKMFDEIRFPNSVSWNVIVRRYLEVGCEREAISMFFQCIRSGIRPLTFTFSNALVACSGKQVLSEGVQIHSLAIKSSYKDDETVSTSLIDMYVKCGDLESAKTIFNQPNSKNVISSTSMISGYVTSGKIQEARELFDEMPERNIVTWNAMLSGYVRFGQWDEALDLIFRMRQESNDFNAATLNSVLNVCAALSDVEFGKQVHGYIYRRGYHSEMFISNSLIDMYGKCGSLRYAMMWFDQMTGWRDTISWNSIMTTFARHRMSEEVMAMFPKMLEETSPNKYTFATLLAASANIFALTQGREIHGFMIRNDYEIDDVVLGAMVDMYSKCRYLDYALKVFKIAKPGDVILWNSMITGCYHHGKTSEAIELFDLMKKLRVEPDYVTFQAVFHACIGGGYIDHGRRFFNAMSSEYFVMPRLEHYDCMIELYCRHGAMTELEDFTKELPFDPTHSMLIRIFDACREYGHSRLGKWAAEHLNKLNPSVPYHF